MADLQVNFMHPIDGRLTTVTLDDSYLGREVVDELIANQFLQPNPNGYTLSVKGGSDINKDHSLRATGLVGGETIRIVPATDAGKS